MHRSEGSTAVQPNLDSFEEIMKSNMELTQTLAATYMFRRYLSLGVKCEYIESNGEFSHIKLVAKEHHYIEVRPVVTFEDGSRTEEPLMRWEAYPEEWKKFFPESHPGGFYYYRARFTLFIDDFDPENPDAEGKIADADGPAEMGTISTNATDFQVLFFSMLYGFFQHHNVEIYPEMRRSRVEL